MALPSDKVQKKLGGEEMKSSAGREPSLGHREGTPIGRDLNEQPDKVILFPDQEGPCLGPSKGHRINSPLLVAYVPVLFFFVYWESLVFQLWS